MYRYNFVNPKLSNQEKNKSHEIKLSEFLSALDTIFQFALLWYRVAQNQYSKWKVRASEWVSL